MVGRSAADIAAAVRAGAVTAGEVVAGHLDRIGRLNAVAVKDCVPVAGAPMSYGSAAFPKAPQDRDHPLMARSRARRLTVALRNW